MKGAVQGFLTLQTLVLCLHAEQQDLLVDGLLPQGPVVRPGPLGPLQRQPRQGVLGRVEGQGREGQQLTMVWRPNIRL